jgi:hypothetical protein
VCSLVGAFPAPPAARRLVCVFQSCSLVLHTNIMAPAKSRFKFEAIWPKFHGYLEVVQEGWHASLPHGRNLDFKLCNTAKSFKAGARSSLGALSFS